MEKMPSKYREKNNFQLRILTLPSYQVRVEKKYFQTSKVSKVLLLIHSWDTTGELTPLKQGRNREVGKMGTRRPRFHHKREEIPK